MNQPTPPGQPGQKMQVQMPDDSLKGVYANNLMVGYSKEEFIMDFMNLFPPKGIVTSRVIVSPGHLKRIISVLTNSLKQYEDKFNVKIEEAKAPAGPDIGFTDRTSDVPKVQK